ncbi:N-acetylneuraminate synthase family protein [Haloarcula hispanica]|uniref:N-acetylneuraminate synthase n=1 Tax=Haloarcula hispanica TaxID=51589 RepID=A0A482T0Q3_HALHI|nr:MULTISPECIES: N-acetylneuraminate synthase family protein [Haloarcula]KZX49241.1 N-acetylneuraminate synthase [Haloarcula sp. K1]MCJ0619395.1 N-acetylneuraminate synthase family protein [Haloarcula hispanica]RYJ09888.1 N-acetylneuraminate synthase [Haloarcula hispanica]
MRIDDFRVGKDGVYFIAEAGVNHNGDLEMAEELVDVAAEAGADAVKFQTFCADRLVTSNAETVEYQQDSDISGTQYEMLSQYELDHADHERLREHCENRGITFLSTPFDPESAEMLADLGVPAIKVGSGELNNLPLLKHIAGLSVPMIISTGMGTMQEVRNARDAILAKEPDAEAAFLHCTSAYPCEMSDVNLRAMETMARELPEPVGYSDHTTAPETPAIAVAAGAEIVEKHFTLNSSLPGPDHEASLEPPELSNAVSLVRDANLARGKSKKSPVPVETENRSALRKGLHAAVDLPPNTVLEDHHIDILRPADGLSPRYRETVLGTRVVRELDSGDPITETDVSWEKD